MSAQRIDDELRRLTAEGVLSAEQADAVRTALVGVDPEPSARRGIHPAAEAAAWVGAVLATVAGITASAAFWNVLSRWSQVGLLLLVSVALLAAGMVVRDDDRPAARRILSVVWFLAVAAFGAAWVIGLDHDSFPARAWPVVVAGLCSTALALPLWRVHTATLQLIAVLAGALTTLIAALSLFERPPEELYALLVWAFGVAVVLLAWGRLARPATAGLILGALTALAGVQGFVLVYQRSGLVLALVTLVGLFTLGAVLDHASLTGLAAVALAVFLPQALDAFFPDSLNASATVFVSGVALLAGALATIRMAKRSDDGGVVAVSEGRAERPTEEAREA